MYGERLRLLRKANRLTIEEVALRIDLAKSSYAGYESEIRTPPVEKLLKLASMYDVSIDYILGNTDDPYPKDDRRDIKEFLNRQGLNYDGIEVDENTIKVIKDVLELVASSKTK
ncbi:helix-turn-helix domain-containing protein [Metabacillus sp. Hm71]|uniref:helix-turn-helix domain-containing protein n=1 Tax=Metabacillus sp. Hm71 TaxID=3450743 RepID=UPI003F41FC29